jgi:hypothetical protein
MNLTIGPRAIRVRLIRDPVDRDRMDNWLVDKRSAAAGGHIHRIIRPRYFPAAGGSGSHPMNPCPHNQAIHHCVPFA